MTLFNIDGIKNKPLRGDARNTETGTQRLSATLWLIVQTRIKKMSISLTYSTFMLAKVGKENWDASQFFEKLLGYSIGAEYMAVWSTAPLE